MTKKKFLTLLIMLSIVCGSFVTATTASFAEPPPQNQYENGTAATPSAFRDAEYDENGPVMDQIKALKPYYSFSIEEDSALFGGISLASAVNSISNLIFGIAKSLTQFTSSVLNYALSFKLSDSIKDYMLKPGGVLENITKLGADIFNNNGKGLNGIVWLGVAFSLVTVVLMFARRQTAGAFGKMLGMILIMVFISSYMVLPNMFMDGAQKFTTEVGTEILGGNTGSDPGEAAAKRVWLMGADLPWQELEFGRIIVHLKNYDGAMHKGSKTNTWLCTYPADRSLENIEFTNDVRKEMEVLMADDVGAQAARAGSAFIILIIDIILNLLFLVLSAVALGFQIGALMMWILGFFVLILALFPTHGINKIREWAGTLALTYFGQIVVYVIIVLVTEIVSTFYDTFESIFFAFAGMIGVGAAVYLMRGPIMSLFSGTISAGGAALGGGVANMAAGAKRRMEYRGDSTERMINNPIRQNREAKRMAQRDAKMQAYQQKMEAKRERAQEKREKSVIHAGGNYAKAQAKNVADKVTAPAQIVGRKVSNEKARISGNINQAANKVETRTTVRQEVRQAAVDGPGAHMMSNNQTSAPPVTPNAVIQNVRNNNAKPAKPAFEKKQAEKKKGNASPMRRR